jgi:arylsulfatase A-like enzyme
MNRSFSAVLLALGFAGGLFSPCVGKAADQPAARPNIVIILADDMGYGDPGCYNKESLIPTPHMDHLASQGLKFMDAHTPSSVCTPTRYGILTGRYCWRTSLQKGVLQGYAPMLIESGRMTVASMLKQQGYATACIGKWHLGLGTDQQADYGKPLRPGPNTVGFDYSFIIPASLDMPPYVFVENEQVTEAPSETIAASEMRRKGGGGFWRAGAIAPHFKHIDVLPTFTQKAVDFIGKQTTRKRFFLYFALNAPHTPWMPIDEFRGKSKADYYGDFVAQVDGSVGRVLQALDDAKLSDNTVVILTSDNGAHWLPEDIRRWGHQANGKLRGQKADIWEGGHRVPFIARWPGKIQPGSQSDELICLTDIMATAAALAEAKLPNNAGEDSFNLMPALLGQELKKPIRPAIVHHSSDGTFAIRQGSWKLAMGLGSHGFSLPKDETPQRGGPSGQLYDLGNDLTESTNLWLRQPQRVARLTALLEKYKKDGRSRPLSN